MWSPSDDARGPSVIFEAFDILYTKLDITTVIADRKINRKSSHGMNLAKKLCYLFANVKGDVGFSDLKTTTKRLLVNHTYLGILRVLERVMCQQLPCSN